MNPGCLLVVDEIQIESGFGCSESIWFHSNNNQLNPEFIQTWPFHSNSAFQFHSFLSLLIAASISRAKTEIGGKSTKNELEWCRMEWFHNCYHISEAKANPSAFIKPIEIKQINWMSSVSFELIYWFNWISRLDLAFGWVMQLHWAAPSGWINWFWIAGLIWIEVWINCWSRINQTEIQKLNVTANPVINPSGVERKLDNFSL